MVPVTPTEKVTLEAHGRVDANRHGWRVGLWQWFGGAGINERVETMLVFPMRAVEAWERIVFFEETLRRPPWILRKVLPEALRVEGSKSHVGAMVRCVYREGEMVKHITSLEWPHLIGFDVMGQRLGVEQLLRVRDGSYRIEQSGEVCRVTLTTRYMAFLHPRGFWRRVEHWLIGMMHRHILRCMRAGSGA